MFPDQPTIALLVANNLSEYFYIGKPWGLCGMHVNRDVASIMTFSP